MRGLREQAIALRQAGWSRSQIKEALGVMDNRVLTEWLRGVPPPEWTRRPNAKDNLRAQAREMRKQGLRYKDIVAKLDVSMSSVSLWVRDLPIPARLLPEANKQRSIDGTRRWWAKEREVRRAQRSADVAAASAQIGDVSDRELLIAGAIAYWCEGTKRKPHRGQDRVVFVNGDPGLISFFIRFLDAVGVPRDDLVLRVHIHETADVESAQRFWLDVTGVPPDQFGKPMLKKHNPKTVRKNTGSDYHGCLRIDVRHGAGLYRKIEGWASAAMTGRGETGAESVQHQTQLPGSRGRIRTLVEWTKTTCPAV
jgi:hypothetical protein